MEEFTGRPDSKADVTVAKNYLAQPEIEKLDRIVTMYLDYAEDQASQQSSMTMANWVGKLDAFLQFNGREVLQHSGTVKRAVADRLAKAEYEAFDAERKRIEATQPTSDFDKFVDEVKKIDPPKDE